MESLQKIEKFVSTKALHLSQEHYNIPWHKWCWQQNRNEYYTGNSIVIQGNEYYTGSSIDMTVNCESVCNQIIKGYADTRIIIMITKEVEYLG